MFSKTTNNVNAKAVLVHATAVPSAPSAPAVHVTATSTTPTTSGNEFTFPFNEIGAREFLSANYWPRGMQDTFIQNVARIPIRFFICDDSGSMIASDGHRLMTHANQTK
jgi:hypothetical protein